MSNWLAFLLCIVYNNIVIMIIFILEMVMVTLLVFMVAFVAIIFYSMFKEIFHNDKYDNMDNWDW